MDECSSFPGRKKDILFASVSRPALVPIWHIKFVMRTPLPKIERLKHEAEWKFTSTPPLYGT
jgi:hypothetical protein